MSEDVVKNQLSFTNNGNLSLFFIGTGSAFSKKYFQTNFLIVKGQDHLLVDCGTLCPFVLNTVYNRKISEIQNVFITHAHADHMGGLEEFALLSKYGVHKKPNFIITDKFKKLLWNQSLRGGIQYSDEGKMTFEDYFNQIKPVRIRKSPYEMYEANIGSINIKTFRTCHITSVENSLKKSQFSQGIIIDDRILCTGDTQFAPDQLNWLCANFNIEQIFHDCDFSVNASKVHASYQLLKTLPPEIKKMMYLCHYSKNSEKYVPEEDGFAGLVKAGVYYNY